MRIIAATKLLLLFAMPAYGASQNASDQEAEQDRTDTIDEIIVYGDKSLVRLRQELYRAEEIVFDLFNSLNSDDEYDIHCYYEAPIGSHIKRRVCKANYLKELTAEATRQSLLFGQAGAGRPHLDPLLRIRKKDKLLQEEMERLIVEQPELLKALSIYSESRQVLEDERQRRCEGRIIICR